VNAAPSMERGNKFLNKEKMDRERATNTGAFSYEFVQQRYKDRYESLARHFINERNDIDGFLRELQNLNNEYYGLCKYTTQNFAAQNGQDKLTQSQIVRNQTSVGNLQGSIQSIETLNNLPTVSSMESIVNGPVTNSSIFSIGYVEKLGQLQKVVIKDKNGNVISETDPDLIGIETRVHYQDGSVSSYYESLRPEINYDNMSIDAQSGGGCPNCLDPSSIGNNLLGLSYPGGNNPLTRSGDYSYSYVPTNLAEYPAIGHDRRYDILGIKGASGLFTDTRAIGADWRFVGEELSIAVNPYLNPNDRASAGILGIGLGLSALPKTLFQLSNPFGYGQIMMWYKISNQGVNNDPTIHKH
jgi:hypothetical protein